MKILLSLVVAVFVSFNAAYAQGLEGIIVERYYQADAADEADALNNGSVVPLTAGSVVYRVFVDMAPAYEFSQIFGTPEHNLTVNGSADFYNDPSYGVAINPATVSANNIRKHTALIDSWFAAGGASNGKVGVLKIEDTDGSVGNQHSVLANNPGGCYGVPINGTNAQDGMTPNSSTTYIVPNALGLGTALEPLDQTAGNSILIDNGAIASLGGIVGPTASNRVMIGQFTLDGDLTFALNVQLINTLTGAAENYVSSNPVNGELTHPTLTYNSNIAPTASITAPANNTSIGFGDYTITVDANDLQGSVASVEFFVDGISIGVDNTFPYAVAYNATVGAHAITAVASDGDCLTGSSQTVNVTVANNQSPVVTLDAPSIAVEGSNIVFVATASDPDGSITQVQFFVNGTLIGTDNSSPYSITWIASLGANQEVTAVATDNSGLSTTSQVTLISVNTNIPPTVTITSPFSTDDFTAPEMIALIASATDVDGTIVSVEFFVNGVSVGTSTSEPYTVNWMSQAGAAEIVAVATDSNGAQTTALSINISVLDPSTEPYAVTAVTQLCNVPTYCVPVEVSAAFPVSGVIGYDMTINYDATSLEPTGNITVSNDLINTQYVDATVTSSSAGVLQVMLVLNGNAPAQTTFQGYGELFCVEFTRLSGLGGNDSTQVSVSTLTESYVAGPVAVGVNSAFMYSELNTQYDGNLAFGITNAPLTINESTSANTPVNVVYGVVAGAITNPGNPAEVDAAGDFAHDLNNGTSISIVRDIENASSVQAVVNGADALTAKGVLFSGLAPSIYQILAMDVNLDGVITAGDISQINQRATLMIGEYQQAWNYDNQGNSNGQPSKDWIFVDQARLNSAAYAISSTFPADDQVGYTSGRVPVVPFVLDANATGFDPNSAVCQEWATENYVAIMLGDANESYDDLQTNVSDSLVFDLSQAVYTSNAGTNYIEVPVFVNSAFASALDVAFKYNQNKLAFYSVIAINTDLDITSHLNSADEFVRLTSSMNNFFSQLPQGQIAMHVKFEIIDNCAAVFSTDFTNVSTWIDGESCGHRFINGSTLPDPIQVVSAGPYCAGTAIEFSYSATIDGNIISSYAWEFGDGSTATGQNPQVTITGIGAVPITVNMGTDNGCTYTVAGEIYMSPNPQVAFTYVFDANASLVTFDNTSTIAGGSITGYSWDFGDTNSSTEADPTHTYASGTYTVVLTATSSQGCVASLEQQVNATVGIEELQSSWISVYPNPSTDVISVYSPVAGNLYVTDLTGKIIVEGAAIGASQELRIQTESWAAGMYQVVVMTEGSAISQRVMKIN
jgi:hypothetical protein